MSCGVSKLTAELPLGSFLVSALVVLSIGTARKISPLANGICMKSGARLFSSWVSDEQIANLCQKIVDRFQPEKIILFGSYAYGKPHEWSDVDLLIVMNFEGRAIDLGLEMWRVTQPDFSVDFIVKSASEIKWRYEQFDPLVRVAIDRGKFLYESSSCGMDQQS